jgi:hypothetical protein
MIIRAGRGVKAEPPCRARFAVDRFSGGFYYRSDGGRIRDARHVR